MQDFKRSIGVADGSEWEPFAGLEVPETELRKFVSETAFARKVVRRYQPPRVAVPPIHTPSSAEAISTQEGFGRILSEIARSEGEFAQRVVTTSPDVTVSTNLGAWVNRRGIFHRRQVADDFAEAGTVSVQKWAVSPHGQHIELGIAENNFFLTLAALGLSAPLHDARLFPVGTLYDTFIGRGLDALNYACYQDARFLLVGTPSGISLGRSPSVFGHSSDRRRPTETDIL